MVHLCGTVFEQYGRFQIENHCACCPYFAKNLKRTEHFQFQNAVNIIGLYSNRFRRGRQNGHLLFMHSTHKQIDMNSLCQREKHTEHPKGKWMCEWWMREQSVCKKNFMNILQCAMAYWHSYILWSRKYTNATVYKIIIRLFTTFIFNSATPTFLMITKNIINRR